MLEGEFELERTLPVPPSRVYRAFSDADERRRWFRMPGKPLGHALDFRVGGEERASALFPNDGREERVEFAAKYVDIVPEGRIAYRSEVILDGVTRSTALVTITLAPEGSGTRLTYAERFRILVPTGDGQNDVGEKRGGAGLMLNALSACLDP